MNDVIVVGLGPAGSTAAYRLASMGYKVVALDKESFPRYKSCGGCVSIKIDAIKDFDFSHLVESTITGATFSFKARKSLDIISDRPLGYNVRRDVFDAFLVEKARQAGARILEERRVKDFIATPGSVTVITDTGEAFKGKFLICADGSVGGVARQYFGFDPKESAISLTAEVAYDPSMVEEMRGKLYIDFGSVPHGYAWIFPKEKFLSVGLAGDAKHLRGRRLQDCFEAFTRDHRVLKDFEIEERAGSTIPFFYKGMPPVTKGRVLAVGDAAHMVDPFLGEGIYFAIKSAQVAAEAVDRCLSKKTNTLAHYTDWVRNDIARDFIALEKLSKLIYNYPRLWFGLIERNHDIMYRYFDVIRGETRAEEFYKWVFSKVKRKPWKVLRGLMGGRASGQV